MTLIDTSAWIHFFRGLDENNLVGDYFHNDEAAYTCPIYVELMVGIRRSEVQHITDTLVHCLRIPFQAKDWDRTAEIERDLRGKGITVPRGDIYVAAVSLSSGLPILCRDRHFLMIRDHGPQELKVQMLI